MSPHRPSTLAQVAARAGVSLTTASKAVNDQGRVSVATRERVVAAARELSYTPNQNARSLITGRTSTVGVVMIDSLTARFAVPVMLGAEEALSQIDLSLIASDARGDHDRLRGIATSLGLRNVDGVLVIGDNNAVTPSVSELLSVPVVYVYGRSSSDQDVVLVTDDEVGGAALAQHVLDLGRRRVAHVTGPRGSAAVSRRLAGIRSALRVAEVELVGGVRHGPWSQRWGRTAGDDLLAEHPDVDAVICGSDQVAVGVVEAVLAAGRRVPQDVAVTGYDNWDLFALETDPHLTTVEMHLEDLGAAAARALFDAIDGTPGPPGVRTLSPSLVPRGSTVPSGPHPAPGLSPAGRPSRRGPRPR